MSFQFKGLYNAELSSCSFIRPKNGNQEVFLHESQLQIQPCLRILMHARVKWYFIKSYPPPGKNPVHAPGTVWDKPVFLMLDLL